jgi:hypothetical protein
VDKEGTLPVKLFDRKLNFKRLQEKGIPLLICYGEQDDLVDKETALAHWILSMQRSPLFPRATGPWPRRGLRRDPSAVWIAALVMTVGVLFAFSWIWSKHWIKRAVNPSKANRLFFTKPKKAIKAIYL